MPVHVNPTDALLGWLSCETGDTDIAVNWHEKIGYQGRWKNLILNSESTVEKAIKNWRRQIETMKAVETYA